MPAAGDLRLRVQRGHDPAVGGTLPGSKRAADGRHKDRQNQCRSGADRESPAMLVAGVTCRFPTILNGSLTVRRTGRVLALDLTRKRTEVQLLPRPLHEL
jgi:hypothetical protein